MPTKVPSVDYQNNAGVALFGEVLETKPREVEGMKTVIEGSGSLFQGTNEFSTVSKRSVERAYSKIMDKKPNSNIPQDYFKHFVKGPRKRSSLINRGYWIRMEAIKRSIQSIITQENSNKNVIVNLGCGFDALPFQLLDCCNSEKGKHVFVDLDYPDVIEKKIQQITKSPELCRIINFDRDTNNNLNLDGISLRTSTYTAIGCDLQELSSVQRCLAELNSDEEDTTYIFLSETSLAYMMPQHSDSVIQQASRFGRSHFVLLEPILPAGPNHPFARTMLNHFTALGTPIQSISQYPNIESQGKRLKNLGFRNVETVDLLGWWYSLPLELRHKIENIETLDVWEELFLFCQHHALIHATNSDVKIYSCDIKQKDDTPTADLATSIEIYKDSSKTNLTRTFAAGSSIDQSKHILVSGTQASQMSTSVLLSDTDAGFKVQQHQLEGRSFHSSVAVGEVLYVFGGRKQSGRSTSECHKLSSKDNENIYKWDKIADIPDPRSRHCSIKLSETEILLFGGSDDISAPAFLLYSIHTNSWKPIPLHKDSVSLSSRLEGSSICYNGSRGFLIGGMDPDSEEITSTLYSFTVESSREYVKLRSCFDNSILGRYGAKLSYIHDDELILIGGVSRYEVFGATNEVVKIDVLRKEVVSVAFGEQNWSNSPLLIGFELFLDDRGGFIVVGGGGTCFTYGMVWNDILTISPSGSRNSSRLVSTLEKESFVTKRQTSNEKLSDGSSTKVTPITEVQADSLTDIEWKAILGENVPVLIKGAYLGSCLDSWKDKDYLISNVGEGNYVTVHEATQSDMNFQKKNFSYRKILFKDFIENVYGKNDTKMYLRAVSFDAPKDKAADFYADFPGLADDFVLPDTLKYIKSKQHSSPLRISSPETSVWLHYDVTSNILCQIIGSKKLRLYPPSQVDKLQFPSGASSSIIDNVFEDEEINKDPSLTPYECTMQPGDILFLPRLWLHATCPLDPSISLNVFWKDLEADVYAAGKDIYGNRDIGAYENSRKAITKIKAVFKNADVPDDVTEFYLKRLAQELLE